jgi:peptide methionine sulfoxide reductase MsrA/tetrahydromethanopterin S-methyltransferase subunit G
MRETTTVPPFGIFKKKPNDIASAEHSIPTPASDTLSIQQAQDLLQSLEAAKVKELSASLAPIKESAAESLKVIDTLAKEMDRENIKLEDVERRLKSVVEHSKTTVVSSLRREASLELPFPQSANDAKKFKERFENMMKRFGEVSGSHSKVLNAFMKKHSGKIKDEFEFLTKLLNETRAIISEFDRNREPIIRCENTLNTALQKISSINLAQSSAKNIEKEIEDIERELKNVESELAATSGSNEFEQASIRVRDIAEAERKQEEFHAQIRDLFSHLSRAFTKYSYGITKETERRLETMSNEPWQILYEKNVTPYSSLLLEIRKSIDSGQIQLKDSDKVLQYIDTILESLPDLQYKAQTFKTEINSFRQLNIEIVYKVKDLEQKVMQHSEELARSRQDLEQQRRQAKDKTEEVDAILRRAGEILAELIGQKYSLRYD